MADPRFYRSIGPVEARELARIAGCDVQGNAARLIGTVAPLDTAGSSDLTFIWDQGRVADVAARRPVACIAPPELGNALASHCDVLLIHTTPRLALTHVIGRLFQEIAPDYATDARIDPSAVLEPGARVAAGARIGARTVIGANAVVGAGVEIGADCRIGAGSVIAFATIGDRTGIGANCAIGGGGFGVVPGNPPTAMPHLGAVRIGDDVRIGALCAIDRAMFDETVIEDHVKMDNHCHVAHNCRIGRGAILAAFAGISGSTTIGAGAMLAGRVGVVDHATVGEGAMLGAGSAVLGDVPAREHWTGYPARPNRQFLREIVALARLAGGTPKDRRGGQ